jgi:hypothetical protein
MKLFVLACCVFIATSTLAQTTNGFSGLDMNLGNIFRLSNAKTRSISPENLTGEPGKGGMATKGTGANASRDLGQGWKVSPSVAIEAGQTFTMADITDAGAIQHIWMTPTGNWRYSILRIYWDDEKEPSVEVPVGDFFGMGWGQYAPLNSLAVTVNPGSAFNCYWPMPFRKKCKITMENISTERMILYYQIDYTLTTVPDDAAYFHAQFRRANPTKGSLYTLADSIKGKGQYVGCYLAWGVNNNGWWGEVRSSFILMAIKNFQRLTAQGRKIIFAALTILRIKKRINTRNFRQRILVCTKSFVPMDYIIRNNVLACIAGTLLILFALKKN